MTRCLDECVVGWKNIVDESGANIPFTKENFELLNNSNILMELYLKVQEMTSGDEKNDESSTTTAT